MYSPRFPQEMTAHGAVASDEKVLGPNTFTASCEHVEEIPRSYLVGGSARKFTASVLETRRQSLARSALRDAKKVASLGGVNAESPGTKRRTSTVGKWAREMERRKRGDKIKEDKAARRASKSVAPEVKKEDIEFSHHSIMHAAFKDGKNKAEASATEESMLSTGMTNENPSMSMDLSRDMHAIVEED